MSDDAKDNRNPSHGLTFYAVWGTFLYCTASLPLFVALNWLHDHGFISKYWAIAFFPFVPFAMLVDAIGESTGSGPVFSNAAIWLQSMLP